MLYYIEHLRQGKLLTIQGPGFDPRHYPELMLPGQTDTQPYAEKQEEAWAGLVGRHRGLTRSLTVHPPHPGVIGYLAARNRFS